MKRWNVKEKKQTEDICIDVFLEEIERICREYDLSISHQDGHGAFKIVRFDESTLEWLKGAENDT